MSAITYAIACINMPVVEAIDNMWVVNGQATGIAHNGRAMSYIVSREGTAWVVKFYSNPPCNCGSQMPNTLCSVGSEYCG